MRTPHSGADAAKDAAEKKKEEGAYKAFKGVYRRPSGAWIARIWIPEKKGRKYIGSYATAEDAARAYDHAATTLFGPAAYRNFPAEDIPEPPPSLGDKKQKSKTSQYHGVSKASEGNRWMARISGGPNGTKYIGRYGTEEEAALAYDREAVERFGSAAKLNFPGKDISE